jgi:hypothetical protein
MSHMVSPHIHKNFADVVLDLPHRSLGGDRWPAYVEQSPTALWHWFLKSAWTNAEEILTQICWCIAGILDTVGKSRRSRKTRLARRHPVAVGG